jgi:hypothetical protein
MRPACRAAQVTAFYRMPEGVPCRAAAPVVPSRREHGDTALPVVQGDDRSMVWTAPEVDSLNGDTERRTETMTPRPDVEHMPRDLDRFLHDFFRRGWRSEIKFDPGEDLLYLVIHLADQRLSSDDRFLTLVDYFVRARSDALRRSRGPRLLCRLIGGDGQDLTPRLAGRGARLLEDVDHTSTMHQRLTFLGLRRRLARRVIPDALLWAAAFVFVVVVVGLPLGMALGLGIAAVLTQVLVVTLIARRGP